MKQVIFSFDILFYKFLFFSIKGDEAQFIYNGDRQTDDIVHFALRVANPPVRQLEDDDLFNRLRKDGVIFFTYLGEPQGALWVSFVILYSNCYSFFSIIINFE